MSRRSDTVQRRLFELRGYRACARTVVREGELHGDQSLVVLGRMLLQRADAVEDGLREEVDDDAR